MKSSSLKSFAHKARASRWPDGVRSRSRVSALPRRGVDVREGRAVLHRCCHRCPPRCFQEVFVLGKSADALDVAEEFHLSGELARAARSRMSGPGVPMGGSASWIRRSFSVAS